MVTEELTRDGAGQILSQLWATPFSPPWPCTAHMSGSNMSTPQIVEFGTNLKLADYLSAFADEGEAFSVEVSPEGADTLRVSGESFDIELVLCDGAEVSVTGMIQSDPSLSVAEFTLVPHPTENAELLSWAHDALVEDPIADSDRADLAAIAKGTYTCVGTGAFMKYDDDWRLDLSSLVLDCEAPPANS